MLHTLSINLVKLMTQKPKRQLFRNGETIVIKCVLCTEQLNQKYKMIVKNGKFKLEHLMYRLL